MPENPLKQHQWNLFTDFLSLRKSSPTNVYEWEWLMLPRTKVSDEKKNSLINVNF